jgi:serine protease Do
VRRIDFRSYCVWLCFTLFVLPGLAWSRDLPEFADMVERFAPAVVNVSSSVSLKPRARSGGQDPNDLFRKFLPPHHPPIPRDEEEEATGSGFIISADGYILTNAHVVNAADEIVVRLVDKREFRARVIGADKRTDVALIKIEANNLPRVTIGDPARLRVGDWVVAIGSPFGFEHSVTAGIVSAKERALPDESFVSFIQTDVAINPGNSGGPLFNLKGEVVGINSQIYSETGGFMGLSFAIPIDVAMDVQNQIRTAGHVTRGRIGVLIQEVTRDVADSFALKNAEGALISELEPNGPAAKAGIQVGDVILRFDARPVGTSTDLPRIVGSSKPGKRVNVQLWRGGGVKDVALTVAEFPEEHQAAPRQVALRHSEPLGSRLGLVVSALSGEQKRHSRSEGGVAVKDARGIAARAQLRAGDVVVSGTRKGAQSEFRSVDQFNHFAGSVERGESVSLLVRRGDTQSFVSLRVPD